VLLKLGQIERNSETGSAIVRMNARAHQLRTRSGRRGKTREKRYEVTTEGKNRGRFEKDEQ